ncbi:biotin/lipoyl-containing protein [Sulfurimonas sp. HSL3-7]|uniref:biotin/lipoyl-containing protein n=1 Tax=Sulfonitrofixus jiaomeiensis TaxID=3131938 RepID=UPI0031F9A5B6
MAKKFIDLMDTTFRDGFQSVFGGRVLLNDFLPAVEAAKAAGITHFEFGGGARFQVPFFYLNENAFDNMDKFRELVGPEANLQTLARGVNTVMLDTGSRELIDLHAKMFKKHGTTTIRNFDALNDINNLIDSGRSIVNHGLKHEVVVTIMDLPPGCEGAHTVEFYEKILRQILDAEIPYHSVCFKDATGTANPQKIYDTVKMAKRLLPEGTHVRLHTQETAGLSVAQNLAALEAGADGIDAAASPVSGGTSQPDILVMMHAIKGKNYDFGFDFEKVLKYESTLKECLNDYFIPPEATMVEPLIQFSPMPGGALTANTQMLRDNNMMEKFGDAILAMREVVEKGGYGTSVTPVSQFYFQQALNNVMQGPWKAIAPGYGKMVLGYFGKTPVAPDPEIVKIASEKLGLEPTTENAVDLADADESKSLGHWTKRLEEEGIETTEENIFIAAACQDKGIAFLKGEAEVNVRKNSEIQKEERTTMAAGNYTVVVDGQKFSVQVAEGTGDVQVVATEGVSAAPADTGSGVGMDIKALLPGAVWKIIANPGQSVAEGETIMILESMKMEIDVVAPKGGVIKSINVAVNDKVVEGQVVAVIG